MSKDSSCKYYQHNRERLKKNLMKNIEIFPKKEKKKSDNMSVNHIKISLKIKNKNWFKYKTLV